MYSQKYFLVDNGSLRPESILYMRKVAKKVESATGKAVGSYGLMHSHKIDADKVEGEPAGSMESFFASDISFQKQSLAILPMFLGPSLAITDWLTEKLRQWQQSNQMRKYSVAQCLHQKKDDRISSALCELVMDAILKNSMSEPNVVLVDHGTPILQVNEVREEIGSQLQAKLNGFISGFSTACMERRQGAVYDFNDPLLENHLKLLHEMGEKEVILAQLFLTPGRHAGPNGDLAKICKPFEDGGMQIFRTSTLGAHRFLVEILIERIEEFNGL